MSGSVHSDYGSGRRAGFTLIELLVVTAILGVVVAAIGASLAGGLRVWDVARRFNRDEADTMMAFQIMRRDFGRSRPMEVAPFEGFTDACWLTAVAPVPDAEGHDEAVFRLARIHYYLDRDRRAWCRGVAPFDWRQADAAQETLEVLVPDVDAVTLRYAAAPEDEGAAISASGWVDNWQNPTNLPGVVEARLTVGGTEMEQWFLLPLAGAEAP